MKKDWAGFSKQGKGIGYGLLGSATLIILATLLHAQTATVSPPPDSIVQVTAEAQGLELVAPADLPDGGTFWIATTNGIMAPSPCPPRNLQDFPVFQMADGIFLVDETGGQVATNEDNGTVESALAAEADAVVNLINEVQDAQVAQLTSDLTAAFGFDDGMDMMMDDSSQMTPTYDTNGLWLELTNVADGWSYFNMHNGTNFVYAVLSTTNLSDGTWNIETELFPTLDQTNVMPFAVQNFDRQILFVKAMDWTGVTENGNTTPDWWFWEYFGTTALSDTNLDSGGIYTLGYDYTYGLDPNIISFTLAVTNNYVNSMSAPVQLDIASGMPNYYAVAVDDINYAADANWQIYAGTNIMVNLGLTEGWHDVWIGLKGLPANATQTWQYKRLKLGFTPPALILTSPANNGTVAQPLIQLAGYSPVALGGISYDLNNAAGLVTNQPVLIIDQYYDPGAFEFTTNTFQAFDLPLTNGVNTITLHATNLAGNVATLATNITLDYSSNTNPPNVQIIWPPAGEQIAGNSFTLRGQVDDPTVTVTASVTDSNGVTTTFAALMERNGNFWLENLPLNGVSAFTVSATNAAGLAASVSLTNQPAPVTLTLTPVSDPSQLWQPTVSVSGTVSDGSYSMTVNGMAATVSGNSWGADNVPVNAGGVAIFDVVAYAPGSTNGFLQEFNQDKPWRLYVAGDTLNYDYHSDSKTVAVQYYNDGAPDFSQEMQDWEHNDHTWTNVSGGSGTSLSKYQYDDLGPGIDTWIATNTYMTWLTWTTTNSSSVTVVTNCDGSVQTNAPVSPIGSPQIASEHCVVPDDERKPPAAVYTPEGNPPSGELGQRVEDDTVTLTYHDKYTRTAQTHWRLDTGGKYLLGRQSLWQLTCPASEILNKRAQPVYLTAQMCVLPLNAPVINGHALCNDGTYWTLLPDGTNMDVTPYVAGKDFYTFWPDARKYKLTITASTNGTAIDLSTNTPEFCVGQTVNLSANWNPALPTGVQHQSLLQQGTVKWLLGGTFVDNYFYPDGCTTCSLVYTNDPNYLTNEWSQVWWTSGGTNPPNYLADFAEGLTFLNGQSVTVTGNGKIKMFRPSVQFAPIATGRPTISASGQKFPQTIIENGGILFQATVTSTDFSGNANWVQVINRSVEGDWPGYLNLSTFGNYCLANDPFYNTQGGLPGTPAVNTPIASGAATTVQFGTGGVGDEPGVGCYPFVVSITDSFKTYLCFKPVSDGIWVTLGRVNWGWSGYAVVDADGTGDLIDSSTNAPTYTDTDEFPVWSSIYTNSK